MSTPDKLERIHDLVSQISKATWSQLTNVQGRQRKKSRNPDSRIDQELQPDTLARLPLEVHKAIVEIIQPFGFEEIAIRFNGSEKTFYFSQQRYPDPEDPNILYEKLGEFGCDVIGPDCKLIRNGDWNDRRLTRNGKHLLVLFSDTVDQLSQTKSSFGPCNAFFAIDDEAADKISEALSTKKWQRKQEALADYRLVANAITVTLAPVLKSMMRYSRFVMSEALSRCLVDSTYQLSYPWKRGGRVPTTTLVLDIRKSTFAMSFALSEKAFAEWMSFTIRLLRRISDKYSAIFDKFTGDGVMIHFASIEGTRKGTDDSDLHREPDFMGMPSEDDYAEIVKTLDRNFNVPHVQNPVALKDGLLANESRLLMAYCCAWEMMHALNHHTRELDSILTRGHGGLGSTVGIGIGSATWSLDRDGNPIVVGPGVVGACRAVDSGDPGCVVVSPTIRRRLAALGLHSECDWTIVPSAKADVDGKEQYFSVDQPTTRIPISPANVISDVENDYEVFQLDELS